MTTSPIDEKVATAIAHFERHLPHLADEDQPHMRVILSASKNVSGERIGMLRDMLNEARNHWYSFADKYNTRTNLLSSEVGFVCALDVFAEWESLVDGDLGNGPSNERPL